MPKSARKIRHSALFWFSSFPNYAFHFFCHCAIVRSSFCHYESMWFYNFLCDNQHHTLTDPYEEKLFSLFASFENGSGFLELSGLTNLAQTLQLKEKGSTLINLLLNNGTRSRVTFKEFREGLLQVITSEDDGNGKAAAVLDFMAHFGWWSINLVNYTSLYCSYLSYLLSYVFTCDEKLSRNLSICTSRSSALVSTSNFGLLRKKKPREKKWKRVVGACGCIACSCVHVNLEQLFAIKSRLRLITYALELIDRLMMCQ